MANEFAEEFDKELARLDLLIHREILRVRAAYQLSLDEYRGVYVSDEQVDALVANTPPLAESQNAIDQLADEAATLANAIGDASPLGRAARIFALDSFER